MVQAQQRGIGLAGARFGDRERSFVSIQKRQAASLPSDCYPSPHLSNLRLAPAAEPSRPGLKSPDAAGKENKIKFGNDVGEFLAVDRSRFGVAPYETQQQP